MTDTLIIYLPELHPDQAHLNAGENIEAAIDALNDDQPRDNASLASRHLVEWALLDMGQKRIRVTGHAELTDLLPQITGTYPESTVTNIIALIPGSQVLLKEVPMPSKQSKHIAKAIPYMLEDVLANDIEENFYAIGKASIANADGENKVPVAVIEKCLMDYWLMQLNKHGIAVDIITTDLLLVPYEESTWTLLLGQPSAWVRTAFNKGIVINQAALGSLLETTIQAAGKESQHMELKIIETQNNTNQSNESQLNENFSAESSEQAYQTGNCKAFDFDSWQAQLQENSLSTTYQCVEYSVFETFCLNYLANSGQPLINFCQGQYRRHSSGLSFNFNWKPPAVLLALLLVIQISGAVYQKIYYQSKADAFKQASIQLYRDYFPESKRIVNVKVQTKTNLQKMSAGSGNNDFMRLVYDIGEGLRQIQEKNSATISLARMSFDNKLGDLRVDLLAKDFFELEKYKQALIDAGLTVDISSAVAGEQGVQARIKVISSSENRGQE